MTTSLGPCQMTSHPASAHKPPGEGPSLPPEAASAPASPPGSCLCPRFLGGRALAWEEAGLNPEEASEDNPRGVDQSILGQDCREERWGNGGRRARVPPKVANSMLFLSLI